MAVESVKVEGLGKRYGLHRALGGVDLELRAGRVCTLLGPNGAGKSTLLGIVSTIVRPTKGKVVYMDKEGRETQGAELRKEIGVLAHDSFLYSGLSALENLHFWGRLYEIDDVEAKSEALLERVGLEKKHWERHAGTFSRGMTQRLAVARSLMHEPSLLLLDEPFTGLDRKGAQTLSETLDEAVKKDCCVLVITHDLESIAHITQQVAVLKRGKLVHESHASSYGYQELSELYHEHTDS